LVSDHADPARRLIVAGVTLRDFRSYAQLELSLSPGLILVVGANGAGKTNLLESLHVGTQGFSPRTRMDAQLVRTGADQARVTVRGHRGSTPTTVEVTLSRKNPKYADLNGARVRSIEHLRRETVTLVFTPDRLALIKGAPAVRRAYVDRSLGRLLPSRVNQPLEYLTAVGQRNAALRRVAVGLASPAVIEPWTHQVVSYGAALVEARCEVLAALAGNFAETTEQLGLEGGKLAYEGDPPTRAILDARLARDLERGTTGAGPHLHDISIRADGRDLRIFGSQGEQRVAVLSLLLAEAEALRDSRGVVPLILLDDVLSELDATRRENLAARLADLGQTVVTATGPEALPVAPSQLLQVTPGLVREAA
jgi:DNA replication and repair protein RecF